MVVENVDKDPKGESQLLYSNEKNCRYCKSPIYTKASVCCHCGRNQNWFLNYFRIDHIGLIIAVVLVALAYFQFDEARNKRIEATVALRRADHAAAIAGKLENLLEQARSIVDFSFLLSKANSDDRGAFDRIVEIAKESGPFQDLANKAKVRIVLVGEMLPKNTSLENELKKLGYAELLRFYHESSSDSSTILLAVYKSPRLTKAEQFDFLVTMIDKDESLMVVKRACLFIKPLLEEFRQTKPGAYHRAVKKCKEYGRAWE